MRGDAFIHFVCGSRRVNIRLGVLLLIPKSLQVRDRFQKRKTPRLKFESTLSNSGVDKCDTSQRNGFSSPHFGNAITLTKNKG